MIIYKNSILIAILVIAAIIDFKFKKVPNIVTIPTIVAGMSMSFIESGFTGFLISTAGLFIGIALLSLPYAAGGMGAGDVKLLGAIGAIKGPWFVFITFLVMALIGGFMAVVRAASVMKRADMRTFGTSVRTAYYTRKWSDMKVPEYVRKGKIPYAIAISAGAAVCLIWEMR
jgi:prepilin peptidase CpaA